MHPESLSVLTNHDKTNLNNIMHNEKTISPTHYCKMFYQWPDNWMGVDEDLEVGEKILSGITPFFQHLHQSGLSKKTIIKHLDNLWILGAQIIRDRKSVV